MPAFLALFLVRGCAAFGANYRNRLREGNDLVSSLGAPKWQVESNVTGPAKWECGYMMIDPDMPMCSDDTIAAVRGFTNVLDTNPGNISQIANRVFVLGEDTETGISTCINSNSAFLGAEASIHSPVRVIIDTQYINRPQCCHGEEINALVLNDEGYNYPWTDEAYDDFENVTEFGLSFLRAAPEGTPCTAEEPCPLVIQIAGAAGNPWFLIQFHCSSCKKVLGAVIISPFLEKDMLTPDGAPAGTSNQILRSTVSPFLEGYIPAHPEINRERVYVLAQSQGDDTALRLALMHPDIISMVSLAGKNFISEETMDMLRDPLTMRHVHTKRLSLISWHIGDLDTAFSDEEYFPALRQQLKLFSPGYPRLDLRIYPQSFHSVWWAAWNSLHEVVWTGQRTPRQAAVGLTTTCQGSTRVEV